LECIFKTNIVMKVDVYIHGVPKGQRIWKTDASDDQIITLFYGAAEEEQTKYLLEVRKSGNDNYCYYSILKYRNVSAQEGRPGSYFGITIRMDMVCTKIQTIFHILDMVYNSDVLGSIVKIDGERLKFLIADFKDVESNCKMIVDKIMAILGQSVEGGDFIAISPSMLSDKGCLKVNLSEFSSENALAYIGQGGSVAISADYPSSQLAAYMKKKEEEVVNLRIQNQQQIENIQRGETKARQEIENRYESEIQAVQKQHRIEVESIKAKYADVDVQIKRLKKEVEDKNRTIDKLHRNVRFGIGDTPYDTISVPHRKPSFVKIISTRIIPFVNLLIVVALFGYVLWQMPSDNTQTIEQISNDLSEIKEKMALDNNVASVPNANSITQLDTSKATLLQSVKAKDVSKTDKTNKYSIKPHTTNNNITNPPK